MYVKNVTAIDANVHWLGGRETEIGTNLLLSEGKSAEFRPGRAVGESTGNAQSLKQKQTATALELCLKHDKMEGWIDKINA